MTAARRRIGIAALVSLLGVAHAASDVELSTTSPLNMPIAPGGQGELTLRVINRGPDASTSVRVAGYVDDATRYPLTMPAQPGCGSLLPGFSASAPPALGWHFLVGPLGVGERVDCRIIVQRAPTTINDMELTWIASTENDPTRSTLLFYVGSLTDISIRVDPVTFTLDSAGFAEGLVRLTTINHGPTGVSSFGVGACLFAQPGFTIDGNFALGCGPVNWGPACLAVPSFGFLRPALVGGESSSCLLRLRSRTPYGLALPPVRIGVDLDLYREPFLGRLIDVNPGDNETTLGLGPLPVVSVDALSLMGQLALIAALMTTAGVLARRTRVRGAASARYP